jgi:hypothetical protein
LKIKECFSPLPRRDSEEEEEEEEEEGKMGCIDFAHAANTLVNSSPLFSTNFVKISPGVLSANRVSTK